tara:strand:- start:104 stop:349 length:246 start_codon:yes stop_codon:yes gene_type:complete
MNNSTDVENEKIQVEKMRKELDEIIFQKSFFYKKMEEYRIKELNTERTLKKICSHKNTIKEKDSGPYPETYIFCQDCKCYL